MIVNSGRTVAVIGAGLVGVAVASYLQRDGHHVFILDPDGPGEGASFGNAGCFNGSSVVPMSMPGIVRSVPHWLTDPLGPLSIRWRYLPTLTPWLIRFIAAGRPEKVEVQARALRGLIGPWLQHLMPLVEDAAAQGLVHPVGHLYAYRSMQGFAKDSPAWELRRQNGVEWDELDQLGLREFDPSLSHDYVRGVLVRANGYTSNPHALVSRLADAFVRSGGSIHKGRAVGFRLDGEQLRAVRTDRAELAADVAVVAAGAWSKPLAAELGDRIPLETERGYHLMIRDPEVLPRIPTTDAEHKFVATPMDTGLRFAGTVELAGLGAPPNWHRAQILLRHGRRMFPALAQTYPDDRVSVWMGHRPSTPDSLPVIGRSRRSAHVFYAFGHGHIGMTAAPVTGRVVADVVAGRKPLVDIAPFHPGRFTNGTRAASA